MGKKNAKNNTQVVEDVPEVELKKEKSSKKNKNKLKNSGDATTSTNGTSPKGSPKLGSNPLKSNKGDEKKISKEPAIPDYKHDNWGHFVREMLVRGITLLVALWVVTLVPVPPADFQKLPDQSFLLSYLDGGLNSVDFVTQILIAAAASVVFDFFVVFYHLTNPPHPKFVLAPARKISIYLHLVAGIIEITTGFAAFFISDHDIQQQLVTIMSIVSIIHGVTGYYQVTVVFGAKGIMVPGYLYAITIHIVSAFRLYHQPTSFVFLFSTYLTLHIYVWCRFFVFIFRYFNTFQHYHYTIAITLSGALLFPYSMGPVGNFGFLFIGTLYCVLHYLVEHTGEDLTNLLFSEHERYALISSRAIDAWKDTLASSSGAESSDKKRAREVFEQYDLDNDGKLSMGEIYNLVKLIGVPINNIARIIKDIDDSGDNAVDVDEFYRYVWCYGNIKERLVKLPHLEKHKLTDQELANLVFEMLDVDDSGSISKAELSVLLSQWGMPCYEADIYLAKYFADEKQMNKQLFFTDMKPIWEFAAREVFQA